MSEENNNENQELKTEDLNLEKKIELDKAKNPEIYKAEESSDADLDGLIRKKNELLNEKKREQMRNRELQEELDRIKGMLRKQEDEKLEEKQEYKTLWENTQREKERIEQELYTERAKTVKEKKVKAFNKVLGNSLSKDRYYDFVDLDNILVEDDGTINNDSVKYAVNLFRENYPELVAAKEFPKVGSQAPSNQRLNTKADISSREARSNLKAQLLRK